MSTVALNQWKNRIKIVNKQYKNEYVIIDNDLMHECKKCNKNSIVNWRVEYTQIYSNIFNKNTCKNYHAYGILKIPNKYCYTSGLNYRYGYKKN